MKPRIEAERCFDVLACDPTTGHIFWRKSTNRRILIGAPAGRKMHNGYIRVCIDRTEVAAHHIVWLFHSGSWPKGTLDHIDGNRSNNQISNLREASPRQNSANTRAHKDNSVGFKGVSRIGKKFRSYVQNEYLGLFDTAEAAHDAYKVRAREIFGEFARVS